MVWVYENNIGLGGNDTFVILLRNKNEKPLCSEDFLMLCKALWWLQSAEPHQLPLLLLNTCLLTKKVIHGKTLFCVKNKTIIISLRLCGRSAVYVPAYELLLYDNDNKCINIIAQVTARATVRVVQNNTHFLTNVL